MRIDLVWMCVVFTGINASLPTLFAQVKLPALLCNSMVLQQKSDAPIWGWAEPGEQIQIQTSWQKSCISTQADTHGTWKTTLNTPKAGGPYTITIKGQNEIILSDVLIGEVWICSGQSNMEVSLEWLGDERSKKDIEQANNSLIRIFDIKNSYSAFEQHDCQGSWPTWRPVNSETVKSFSAVGYYFGKYLQEDLRIPIGLISSNWGGTPAESWIDLDTIRKFERLHEAADILTVIRKNSQNPEDLIKHNLTKWLEKVTAQDQGIKNKWFNRELVDVSWQHIDQPGPWSHTALKEFDGIIWFRKDFVFATDANLQDSILYLGNIDDIDSVWVNGNFVGTTYGRAAHRMYNLPAAFLNKGRNIITIRIIDTGGEGGFLGMEKELRIESIQGISLSLAGQWKYKISIEHTGWQKPDFTSFNQNFPGTLYNAMISPLIPFRITGVIWYQGEGNVRFPIEYRSMFPALIENWRIRWGQGNFPFYYVQIAPWQYDNNLCSQALREAQMMSLSVPDTGMVVTMDIGQENTIHPRNKYDVGERLARWALNKTYGKKEISVSGPLYKKMRIEENRIRLFFDYCDGGLIKRGSELTDFTVAGSDGVFLPAKAIIDGNSILVSNLQVKNPVAVRYGWSNWTHPNLFNTAGLPASSFRTDDWPL